MKRRSFILLIVIMSLSLAGIIAIQLIWINNAIKLRKQEYRTQVLNVLAKSSEQIENNTYLNFISSQNYSFPVPPKPPGKRLEIKLPEHVVLPDIDTTVLKDLNLHIVKNTSQDKRKRFTISKNGIIVTSNTSQNDTETNIEISVLDNDSVVIINQDTIIQEFSFKRLKEKEKRINWVADKFVTEVMVQEEESKPDFASIKDVVSREWQRTDIPLSYNLALIDSGKITQSIDSVTDTIAFVENSYQAMLFPNDIIKKDMFLAIRFDNEKTYLLKSLNWLMAASILFTLLILTAFIFSIYSILVQKKISEVKSDFINNMTHEFKTPIATIAVAADSLVNKKVIGEPKAVSDYAQLIKQENKRMHGHVERILSVAKMERREVEFNFEAINIHELIFDLCERFKIQIEAREGSLDCNLQADNPVISADYEHIYNCVSNLLDNAEKYSPKAPRIKVSAFGNAHGITIVVADKGIGISRQMQQKIFDTFYRISTGNVHNVKGFGLGLSYVKAVCHAHKGHVTLYSEPGVGSSFKLFLPYSR